MQTTWGFREWRCDFGVSENGLTRHRDVFAGEG